MCTVVALDLDALEAAVRLKVLLEIALARAVDVKVDHEQRRRRLGLLLADVLAPAHLPVALRVAARIGHPISRVLHAVRLQCLPLLRGTATACRRLPPMDVPPGRPGLTLAHSMRSLRRL